MTNQRTLIFMAMGLFYGLIVASAFQSWIRNEATQAELLRAGGAIIAALILGYLTGRAIER